MCYLKITEFVQKNDIILFMNSMQYKIIYPTTKEYFINVEDAKVVETLDYNQKLDSSDLFQKPAHDSSVTDLPSFADADDYTFLDNIDLFE